MVCSRARVAGRVWPRSPWLLLVAGLLLIAAYAAAMQVHTVAWRLRVVQSKLAGSIPEIPWVDLARWLVPGSPVYLEPLALKPSVHSQVISLDDSIEAALAGAKVYEKHCAQCHGESGRGRSAPDLVKHIAGATDWAFFSTVRWGRPGTAMAAQPVTESDIWQVRAYLRRVAVQGTPTATAQDAPTPDVLVPADRLLDAVNGDANWLTYSGAYSGHRHSTLKQITPHNISGLGIAWIAQLRNADNWLQSSPIVVDGVLYATESPDGVVAFDAATGQKLWQFRRPLTGKLSLCCGTVNRGVAVLGRLVYVVTADARLVALDAATGRKRWEVAVADPADGYSLTGAPLAVKDRVIVGAAGGEFGSRGFLAAYSANDGARIWKFDTVPEPGAFGHETWSGDSWKTGGAPVWTTGSYDKEQDVLFWGIGNPAPEFNASGREGDNLFSNSIVAIDLQTGKRKWHFQTTPRDERDWDATQQPLLVDAVVRGARRSVVVQANRNGFVYALDRTTGEFLFGRPYAKQTWASGLTREGRPIETKDSRPSAKGTLISPAVFGATNWWPPSYDATRGLAFVPAFDAASIYFNEKQVFKRGDLFVAGSAILAANVPVVATVRAINVSDGSIGWEAVLARGGSELPRIIGGVLSTASGIVFVGYGQDFLALDSDRGQKLWSLRLGGEINAPPIAFSVDGRQHIAIVAGASLHVLRLNNVQPSAAPKP
jgi:alcohol dehydrogenase (cytochrome c)